MGREEEEKEEECSECTCKFTMEMVSSSHTRTFPAVLGSLQTSSETPLAQCTVTHRSPPG